MLCSLFQAFAEYPGSSAQLRVLLAFYASTIVSALVAAENLSDNVVAKLFPYIQKVSQVNHFTHKGNCLLLKISWRNSCF